jgi:cell division transport system permease protein
MIIFFKRAVQDILRNRLLNIITVITIALSIIIIGSFAVFIINANDILHSWKRSARIMVYLNPDISIAEIPAIKQKIIGLYGVKSARFISKDEALSLLKKKMRRQTALLDNLRKNPLPDAFEIEVINSYADQKKIEVITKSLESFSFVEDLEYGRKWIGRFVDILRLFRLAGIAVGGLFFIAAVFIVANTIRLVLYSRREEVEIMRLVGATEWFIKIPFFIEGIIQGVLGGIIGLAVLYLSFLLISSNLSQGVLTGFISLRFFDLRVICLIILSSMFVGWLGCFLSFIHFKRI